MTTPSRVWIGPIELNDGVKAVHFLTLVLIAFLCVPLMSKLQTMNAYVLAEHLLIPRSEMGTVSGNLMSVQEIAIILCIIPLGMLVDKSG
ncbi:MAG: MFS transporter, partial [Gammaproteobacteria bacterium]